MLGRTRGDRHGPASPDQRRGRRVLTCRGIFTGSVGPGDAHFVADVGPNLEADLVLCAGSPNGVRTRVSTLRVFSGSIPLPAAISESSSPPADSLLQPFSSFLDVSRSFAGRMRDERRPAQRPPVEDASRDLDTSNLLKLTALPLGHVMSLTPAPGFPHRRMLGLIDPDLEWTYLDPPSTSPSSWSVTAATWARSDLLIDPFQASLYRQGRHRCFETPRWRAMSTRRQLRTIGRES